MAEPLTTALAKSAQSKGAKNALALLARSKPEIAKVLPAGVGIERFERIVRTEIRRTPELLDCDPQTFLGGVMHCAHLNLEPGPLGLIYLIPYKQVVTVIVGYRGYVELAYRSGLVRDISAELVYEGDTFSAAKGTSPKIVHVDAGPPADRAIVAAYAVAHLKAGGTVSAVIYEDQWKRARKASTLGAKNQGPWRDHTEAMIRKTALRRLEPMLPKSPAIAYALPIDDTPAPRLDEVLAEGAEGEPAPAEGSGNGES